MRSCSSNSRIAFLCKFWKDWAELCWGHQMLVFLYYRIHQALLTWFESFLTGCHQTGIRQEGASKASHINSGVPQGIVLGPLLFLMYVNDLPNWLHSEVKLFADGARWYGFLTNDANCTQLQAGISAQIRGMAAPMANGIQPLKCKTLWISMKQNPPKRKYTFCGTEIDQVESISYLVVIISSKVKWFQHIAS